MKLCFGIKFCLSGVKVNVSKITSIANVLGPWVIHEQALS